MSRPNRRDAANSCLAPIIHHPKVRLIEDGYVNGANFIQVGLRGWAP
ncbi:hypothetical protein ACFLV7_15385 [Chloroflexota bacterium]